MKRTLIGIVSVVALASAAAVAQNALAQFKVTEAQARDTIITELSAGVGGHMNRPAADMARKAYAGIPASARAQATTALYAWTKAYVNTPAFKTAYAAFRKENMPVETTPQGTVDEEVKRLIAKDKAELEKNVKEYLAAGRKAQADAMRKQGEMFDTPMYAQMKRLEVEENRARNKQNTETGMAHIKETLPPNPNDAIAMHLQAFLAATPDVDFAAKQVMVQGEGGESMRFVNAAYNKKAWQWQLSYAFGPEAIAAARAAAQAWLKEMGK